MFFPVAFFPVYSAYFQLVYPFVALSLIDLIMDQYGSKSASPNIAKSLTYQFF